MIDLRKFQTDSDGAKAMRESLLKGTKAAVRPGGQATWRSHFRASMAMCIG